ncbi:sigma-70 family RNA polymerase sigma factor [Edaphobacter sp. HDX4]|uniref:RNA polymerase sigma factor n=1 Tax=Edaphobacter sp. HDX4 TaxID=2794064 RepID=UPI002FE556B8
MSISSSESVESPLLRRVECAAEIPSLEEEVLHLHDQFRPRLLRYAVSMGLKAHDAEDVIQEVFLALFRHLQAERSRVNLPGWVFRVTHNLALKKRIRYRLEDCIEEGASERWTGELNPEEELIFNERQRTLRRTFQALPEVDRLCVQLRAEGLKYREIARILGISLGGVANTLARSFHRLQRSGGGGPCA